MSTVAITDKRGGVFRVEVDYTYGECDRLPYNALRKVNARIEQIPSGGIRATADFNIRNGKDAAHFVEVLDLFGADGSFVHGSPADPEALTYETPPEGEDDGSGIRVATAVSAHDEKRHASSAVPSPESKSSVSPVDLRPELPEPEVLDEEAEDLEIEDETEEEAEIEEQDEEEVESEIFIDDEPEEWERLGRKAIAESLAANENRTKTLLRVAKASGGKLPVKKTREVLLRLLMEKHDDADYVVDFMQKHNWREIRKAHVESAVKKV